VQSRGVLITMGEATEHTALYIMSIVRLGIDGIVDVLQVHFLVTSGMFRIRGLRKHHEIRRYSSDDVIAP
jgi:hypothetical protein